MVNCAVYGCNSRTKRSPKDENFVTVGFFSIPKGVTSQCTKTAALTTARRAEWFRRIRCVDLDESSTHYRVCGAHFVSGRPAYVMDDLNPDWAPSIKYRPYAHIKQTFPFCFRYKRAQSKKSAQHADAEPSPELSGMHAGKGRTLASTENLAPRSPLPPAASEPVLGECSSASGRSQTQDFGQTTDLTLESMALLEAENRQLMSDLKDAKAKLATHCLNEDTFQQKEMVLFYTGLPNFAILLAIFQLVQSRVCHSDCNCLTKFQEMIVFLIRLRLNTPLQDLAYRFQVSQSTVSRIVDRWLAAAFTTLANGVIWPQRSVLRETMPMVFCETFGTRVAVILDCFEVFIA
ncbi:unnamed protein product [Ixodes hexagonus]